MKSSENIFLKKLIKKKFMKGNSIKNYPLASDTFAIDDLISGIKVMISGRLTMSEITKKFEKEFARYVGSKYALMVNSGSSANLLAFFCLVNPKAKQKLRRGDECLIPSLCWSTSLWPILQSGLKPKFVDVDVKTLNMNLKDLKKKISKKTKAIMAVHILGNSTNMTELIKISKNKNLQIIEDTCESLGSKFKNKSLGTFGRFGTFSFYVSHQITSGEGGMIVCNDKKDYEILHSLRAHGWDRGLNKKNNKNFNFINSGFNLRPMDITASIALNQLRKLNKFKKNRSFNRDLIIKKLLRSKTWSDQFQFIDPVKYLKPSWFGLPILLKGRYIKTKKNFLNFLNKNKIETRPIISGNFLNQPSIKLYKLNKKNEKFKSAQEIEDRGFFIGLPTEKISLDKLNYLTDKLLKIDKFL
jgi:CDP-6-deoxy-D-xylo-4-hexulose-3-dehydrase|tara:strand:+ start:1519 stop:2760 length:1242 start_codon:yes stop_codon:yes gene_type:complete